MHLKNKTKQNIYTFGFVLFQVLIFSFLFNTRNLLPFSNMEKSILEFLIILNSYWFITKGIKKKDDVFNNKYMLALFIFINIIISFFVGGKQIFLNEFILETSFRSLVIFTLLNLNVFPLIFNFILLLDKININEKKKKKINEKDLRNFFLIIFFMTLIINTLASIGFFPGNMTSDSIDIACQAMGKYGIGGGHPAFYTILLRFVFMIVPHVYGAILFNHIFMSLILAYIFTYLYKNNVKKNILLALAFIFNVSCNNLSLMTIFWKDIPFTISMLWLTFEIYRIVKEKDEYFKSNINITRLIVSLIFVYLLRVNGMFPYFVTIGYLIYYAIKTVLKKPVIITILLSIFSIWFIKNPVFNFFNVESSSLEGGAASFVMKGIASLPYYDAKLSKEDYKFVNSIAPTDILKESYSKYNIDTISFGANSTIIGTGMKKVGNLSTYKFYIKQLFINPRIIIRDRLDSNNLLWSYVTPDDGFNSTYVIGVWYPVKIDPSILNMSETEKGVYIPKSNILNVLTLKYQQVSSLPLFYTIIWRPAVALTLLLLLIYYLVIKKIRVFPILYPTIISVMFWFMLLSHQSYRYIWFIYVNTFVLYIISAHEKNK